MSQSLKVHSVWLSVSLLSFIIGFKFFPSSSENDNSAFKKNVPLTSIGKDDVGKSSGGLTNKKSNAENEIGVGTSKKILPPTRPTNWCCLLGGNIASRMNRLLSGEDTGFGLEHGCIQ